MRRTREGAGSAVRLLRSEQDPVPRLRLAHSQGRPRRRLLLPGRGADRAGCAELRRGELRLSRAAAESPGPSANPAYRLRVALRFRADEHPPLRAAGRSARRHRVLEAPGYTPVPRELRRVPPHAAARARPLLSALARKPTVRPVPARTTDRPPTLVHRGDGR